MQIHTAHRYFKSGTLEIGTVLGAMNKKIDIGTVFDNFRDKLKGYLERNLYNATYVMCVVTDVEDPIKTFEEDNMPKYLDEDEAKSILKNKRL